MSVSNAVKHFKKGGILIVTDHHERENEGDLIMAASLATPEKVNFMTKYGRGLICAPITQDHARQLQLPLQPRRNNNDISCAFTTSIDAACLTTSGISAFDRSLTLKTLATAEANVSDFSTPGHIFPVCAHLGGLAERHGHTEASIELCLRSGLFPAAVICEILDDSGAAALKDDLDKLSMAHNLPMISIAELLESME